jgi:hypothetical protein
MSMAMIGGQTMSNESGNVTSLQLVENHLESLENSVRSGTLALQTSDSLQEDIDDLSEAENDLNPKASLLLSGLLRGNTIEASAKEANLSTRQAMRYISSESFQSAMTAARRQLLDGVQTRLIGNCDEAISTLLGVIRDPKTSASVRVKASSEILNWTMKTNESFDLNVANFWLAKVTSEY